MNFEKEAREIEMAYETAAQNLMTLVSGIDTETYSELAASRVRERAGAIVFHLNRVALRWTHRKVKKAYDEERHVSANRLLAFGARRDKRFDLKRHAQTVKRIVDGTFKDLFRANESMKTIVNQYLDLIGQGARAAKQLQAFTAREKARIGDLVQNALIEDESRNKLRRRIMDYLRDRLNGDKFITIRGRNYRIGKYIDLVAGVRLREAATEATINSAKEYDHDLVEVPYKMNSCPEICVPLEGKVYSISGETPGYPVLEKRTPFHPHCRHYTRVVSEGRR
jgi:hypothetical protein